MWSFLSHMAHLISGRWRLSYPKSVVATAGTFLGAPSFAGFSVLIVHDGGFEGWMDCMVVRRSSVNSWMMIGLSVRRSNLMMLGIKPSKCENRAVSATRIITSCNTGGSHQVCGKYACFTPSLILTVPSSHQLCECCTTFPGRCAGGEVF